jgi:UDPglucose 6-dehydrogenase
MKSMKSRSKKMNVLVIGAGYVGLTTACCLADIGHNVTCVEKNRDKIELLEMGTSPINEHGLTSMIRKNQLGGNLNFTTAIPDPLDAKIAIMAVGTPSLPNGAADLGYVHQAVRELLEVAKESITLVMKSTVPPGTGLKLINHFATPIISYASNPEFLREGQAVHDWFNPSRIIIGTEHEYIADEVLKLYKDIEAPIVKTDITSAETIKYTANAFLVTKISFINEIANLCDNIHANIDDVARGIGLDSRIGSEFLRAGLGYGGSCFPKDARALNFSAIKNGYDFRLLKATIEVNTKQPIFAVRKLRKILGNLEGKEIALLGLAFKPNTDDVRESPALDMASLLSDENVQLRVYDPSAMGNALPYLPAGTIMAKDIYSAVNGSHAVILATEWDEFVQLDWSRIKESMQEPWLVFDGRNALNQHDLQSLGFKYIGIGRKRSRDTKQLAEASVMLV